MVCRSIYIYICGWVQETMGKDKKKQTNKSPLLGKKDAKLAREAIQKPLRSLRDNFLKDKDGEWINTDELSMGNDTDRPNKIFHSGDPNACVKEIVHYCRDIKKIVCPKHLSDQVSRSGRKTNVQEVADFLADGLEVFFDASLYHEIRDGSRLYQNLIGEATNINVKDWDGEAVELFIKNVKCITLAAAAWVDIVETRTWKSQMRAAKILQCQVKKLIKCLKKNLDLV